MSNFVVGISGASGAIYGARLVYALARHNHQVHVVISRTGRALLAEECDLQVGSDVTTATEVFNRYTGTSGNITVYADNNLHAAIASGSFITDGMAVAPASMKAVSALANGYAESLLGRAADVHIKEQRPLVIVPREAPLSPIHLNNLLTLSRLSRVSIIPASPAFYTRPQSVEEMVDFIVARVLDYLSPGMDWAPRWSGPGGDTAPPI